MPIRQVSRPPVTWPEPRRRHPVAWLHARVDDLFDALATGPVMAGVIGSLLLVLGSLTPAFLPRASQAGGDLTRVPWAGSLLVLLGCALVLHGWLALQPGRPVATRSGRPPRYAAVLVLWSAPLVCGPPILSGDAYAYAAQGWLLVHGLDPYQVGPGALPGPWSDQVDPMWLQTPTPYGPLALTLQWLTVSVAGTDNVYAAAWAMRLWALLGTGLLAFAVPRIADRVGADPRRATWLGVLNPLVLLHFIGGAHNDALMMGLVAFGLWLAVRRHLFWAAIAVGLAAGVKQPAVLAVVAITVLALRPGPEPAGRARAWPTVTQLAHCGIALVVAFATFVLSSIGYGFGWISAMSVPGGAMTLAPFTQLGAGLQLLLNQFGWYEAGTEVFALTRLVGLAAAAVVIVWLALRVAGRKPMTYLVAAFGALVAGFPALHAWYLLWPGSLIGLLPRQEPSRERWLWWGWIMITMFWIVYAVGDFALRNQTWPIAPVAVAVGVGQLAAEVWRTRGTSLSFIRQ